MALGSFLFLKEQIKDIIIIMINSLVADAEILPDCCAVGDFVQAHRPVIHETKLVLVSHDLMRSWIRERLEVSARVQSLLTLLQIKCYMFTMPDWQAGVSEPSVSSSSSSTRPKH
jgi:hypothetical protein